MIEIIELLTSEGCAVQFWIDKKVYCVAIVKISDEDNPFSGCSDDGFAHALTSACIVYNEAKKDED